MDERLRAWSLVALSLLSAILIYVLVRRPPSVRESSHAPPAPHQTHVHTTPAIPQTPSGPLEENPDLYRGWPLFLGWPLPEVPTDWGTGGSGPNDPHTPVSLKPQGTPSEGDTHH